MTDPIATRIVEVRAGADAAPLLLVDGVPVDLAPGEDPEQAGMDLLADDARQGGRSVSAVLVLDGGSTRCAVQVHPDGTVTDQAEDTPPAPRRRRRPVAWLAGAAALALLAGGGYIAITTASTSGPDAPAASGIAIPTWASGLSTSAEHDGPATAPASTTPTTTPSPEPAPALAAAPEPELSSPVARETARSVRAPAETAQSAPAPAAADPAPARPDEQPVPAQHQPDAAPLVEQDPGTAASSSPATGSSQRSRSLRPSSSASATPSVLSSQRGQSGK